MCDKDGYVYGSRMGIERASMIDPDWHENDQVDPWYALMSPDSDSSDRMRAPENQGRRIEEVPGGFRLLNFAYYRGLRNDDDRREQNRRAQEKFRLSHSQPKSASVSRDKPLKAHTETDADSEAKAEAKKVKDLVPAAPKQSAKDLVESFTLEQKHRDWGRSKCPSVPLDAELDAWKDRMRANGYVVGKSPVKDPQAAFYTSCRNAEAWRTYGPPGARTRAAMLPPTANQIAGFPSQDSFGAAVIEEGTFCVCGHEDYYHEELTGPCVIVRDSHHADSCFCAQFNGRNGS